MDGVKEESAVPIRVARSTILVGEVAQTLGLGRMVGEQGEEGMRVDTGSVGKDVFSKKLSVCRARSSVAKGMGLALSRKSC